FEHGGRRRTVGARIEEVLKRHYDDEQQEHHDAAIHGCGHNWRQQQLSKARNGIHEAGPKYGLTCASILNCSPDSFWRRVVGAKNVARVNCGDCSISRISGGASCARPTIWTLSPSTRSSVT